MLDYPYVYRVDEAKLFCNRVDEFGNRCTGLIDYDAGFNHLFCTKCGKRYLALDLEDKNPVNDIVIRRGGKYPMKVTIVNSDGTRTEPIRSSSVMVKPAKKSNNKFSGLKVRIGGSEEIVKEDKPEAKNDLLQKDIKETTVEETSEVTQETPEETKEDTQTEIISDEHSSESEVTTTTETDGSETSIKDESVPESIPEVSEEETKKQEPVNEEEIEKVSPEDEKKTPAKKPSTKKSSTSSKVKVSGKAKVATKSSKSTVKSNFIETEE